MTSHIPRKRFGQNFLTDQNIIAKIVDALNPLPEDNIVEIGAGLGALTQLVLKKVNHLQVIEIDRDLCAKLCQTYDPNKMTVHQQDVLDFDFNTLNTQKNHLRVFGNLPYNISTPLLFHLILYAPIITDMLFMLQKEVVMRICAQPGTHEYGRLSVMLQYHCKVHRLFDISPNAFSPPPKVMSSVIRLKPYGEQRPFAQAVNHGFFSKLVATAFQYRRKTLRNAVKTLVHPNLFESAGIDPMRRPETLSISEFVELSNHCFLQSQQITK